MKRIIFTAALTLPALLIINTATAQSATAPKPAVDDKVAPADNKQQVAAMKPAEAKPVQPLGSFVKTDNPQPAAAAATPATNTATAAATAQFKNAPAIAPTPQQADKPKTSTIPADPKAMPAMPPSIPYKQ